MALYNSEAINEYPTENFSLKFLNKINSEQISFVCFKIFLLLL